MLGVGKESYFNRKETSETGLINSISIFGIRSPVFEKNSLVCIFFIQLMALASFFILLTPRDHMGRSTRNSNPVMTSSAGGAKSCSDQRFRAPTAYTAQLLTLHQHIANNQYRICLLYTSPSPRDRQKSRMPSSA